MAPRLPYPGLRPFRRDEADLFFGRDDEIDTLIARLATNRFLGVLGASGSGKSSLVRTGLFEALDGGVGGLGSRWRIADCHPGDNPIANLARALSEASQVEGEKPDPAALEAWLRRGPRSIVEWCHGHIRPGWRLLILVDQFEELFNYNSIDTREDAHAFAALLVESVNDSRVPIYVVLTMRSDYFGACGAYPALAEAVSNSLFLTPRMLREACHEAIVGPSVIGDFDIDDGLLTALLNDMERFAPFQSTTDREQAQVGRQADQLPLMQYALNRMWQRAASASPKRIKLTVEDYQAINGISGALNIHGDQILKALNLDESDVERVFRALVRGPSVALATRDPHKISEIAAISGLDVERVIGIVAEFAGEDCMFLRADKPLRAASFVDINHESLIRQWSKLAGWLKNEASAAESWRNLAVAAAEWREAGKPTEAVFRDLMLERRQAWMKQQDPTEAWVARYHVDNGVTLTADLATVKAFLAAGEAQRLADVRKAQGRRRNGQLMGATAIAAVLGSMALGIAYQYSRAETSKKLLVTEERNAKTQLNAKNEQLRLNARLQTMLFDLKAQAKAEKAALQREREAVERMTLLAARERQARNTAEAAIDGQLQEMETAQAEIGHPLADSIQSANRVADLLGMNESTRSPRDPERAARLLASASLVTGRSVGTHTLPSDAAESMEAFTPMIRRYSRSQALISKSHILDGQAAELRQDYPRALAAYERALSAGKSSPLATDSAMEAATSIIRLHRRVEVSDRADSLAAWCLDFATKTEGWSLAAKQCEAAAAEWRLDQNRREEAIAILSRLEEDLEQRQEIEAASGDPPDRTFARLKLKILVTVLRSRAGSDLLMIDEKLLQDAERHADANPNTEEATSLYAAALVESGDRREAYDISAKLLESDVTTTGFLLDSVPLLVDLEKDDEILISDGPGQATIEKIRASRRLLAVLVRLDQRGAPEITSAYDQPELRQPRTKLINDVEARLDQRSKAVAQMIRRQAEQNDLVVDLRLDNRTHVSAADRKQISETLSRLGQYRATCEEGIPGKASSCIQYLRETEDALKPVIDRFGPEAVEQARPKGLFKSLRAVTSTPTLEPWLNGYDVVSYHVALPGEAQPRAVRGSEAFPLAFRGKTLLFANRENRTTFEIAPDRYLPSLGGNAVDWLKVNERRPGNPRFFCAFGERILLFDSQDEARRCGSLNVADQAKLISDMDETRRRLGLDGDAIGKVGLDVLSPVPGGAPQIGDTELIYTLIPGQEIVAPAGGSRRFTSFGIGIEHGDGSISELRLVGGSFEGGQRTFLFASRARPELISRGKELPYIVTGAATPKLSWRVRRPTPDGKLEYVNTWDLLVHK